MLVKRRLCPVGIYGGAIGVFVGEEATRYKVSVTVCIHMNQVYLGKNNIREGKN